jgi:hypothetical protein
MAVLGCTGPGMIWAVTVYGFRVEETVPRAIG